MFTAKQLKGVFDKSKSPGKDYLNFDEFYACITKVYKSLSDQLFLQLFQIIDANGNEKIELSEFVKLFNVLAKIPYRNSDEIYFELADLDGNGVVDLHEVCRICGILGYDMDTRDVKEMLTFYGHNNQLNRTQFCDFIQQVKENTQ